MQRYRWAGAGRWEVKRERARGVAFSEKCRITGASWWGDGEHNCARCVDRAVWGWGVKGWGEKAQQKKKGREGTPQLPVLPLTFPSLSLSFPLSLSESLFLSLSPRVSLQTDPLSVEEAEPHFHRQMHIPLLCSRLHSLPFFPKTK